MQDSSQPKVNEHKRSKHDKSSGSGREKSCVPSFINKTFDILQKQEHGDIICWSENGLSFYVKNIKEFEEKILPAYFRHKNFASFVRQLNMYDFHKIRGEQKHIFEHKLFQRHAKNLLTQIRRKCFKKSRSDSDSDGDLEELEPMTPYPLKDGRTIFTPREEVIIEKKEVPIVRKKANLDKENEYRKDSENRRELEAKKEFDTKKELEALRELEEKKEKEAQKIRETLEREKERKREKNMQLMNEIIASLRDSCLQSDREIKERINMMRSNPRYEGIRDKCYVYEIYKRLKEGLQDVKPRRSIDDLDELSIEEDILYNEIERPSKFKIVSLTNFETQNFMLRSSREVIRNMTGDGSREYI